jgi:hypothetical protein
VQADDLAPPVGVDRHRDGHDAAALALPETGGVEPEIGPGAFERTVEKGADPLVDVLAELGDLALGDAGEAHGLHEIVDAVGRVAADPSLLDDGDQRFLAGLARLEEGREVRALAQLRDA